MAISPIVFCLLLLFTVGICNPTPECPHSEDLLPCSCKALAFGFNIICSNVNSNDRFAKTMDVLKEYRVHTVLLHAFNVKETLPSDLFDGLQVKEIRVEDSKIRFSQPTFSGLDSTLTMLDISKSSIAEEEQFSLANLNNLDVLRVKGNHLGKLEDEWLKDKLPSLQTLVLDSDEITEIEDNVFSTLSSLKTISLSENRIKTVKRSMFPRTASQLLRIDLSFNEIGVLPEDFFSDMPSLKQIVLSGNEIKSLPEKTWSSVWEQLTQVLLFENQLECGEDIQWIKDYKVKTQLDGQCVLPKNMHGRSVKDIYKT